jgi:hypothetical protein
MFGGIIALVVVFWLISKGLDWNENATMAILIVGLFVVAPLAYVIWG